MTPQKAPPGRVYAQVYEIVCRIPTGKVLTYGLISSLLGGRLSAQGVGWALRALPEPDLNPKPAASRSKGGAEPPARAYNAANVPWHRVVNAAGGISTRKNPDVFPGEQRRLLEREGIEFDQEENLDLQRYLWNEGLS